MNDDDRRLADRLSRYESRVPVSGAPVELRSRRVAWAAVAGVAAVVTLAVVLGSNLLGDEPAVGNASLTPSVSPVESLAPSAAERQATPITGLTLGDGGRILVVQFTGNDGCVDYGADVTRTADVLEVTVYGTPRVYPSAHPCGMNLEYLTLEVALDPPFTGSEVRDGLTGETFSVAVASATATPAPTTPATTPGPIVRWAQAAAFTSEGWATEVRDMTYAAGRFIAIGYREPHEQRGHVGPPIDEALIWISSDGRSWEQVDPGAAFQDGHPHSIVALPDGSAVAYGTIDPAPPASSTSGAWWTADGRTWTPLDLALPRADWLTNVVGGPHGLLTAMTVSYSETDQRAEIWHSVDGASWRVAHTIEPRDGFQPTAYDWQAGPEGFVVTGIWSLPEGEGREERAFAFASGDGETWFEAQPQQSAFSPYTRIAPLHADWVVAANELEESTFAGRATTWFSPNGLSWEERGAIDTPMPTSPYPESDTSTVIGQLVSTGERVIASGNVVICCHGPIWAAGVWSSFDGRSWERLGFPDGTVVSAAAEHDGIVVLGGFDRARPEDDFKTRAVFWIGERE